MRIIVFSSVALALASAGCQPNSQIGGASQQLRGAPMTEGQGNASPAMAPASIEDVADPGGASPGGATGAGTGGGSSGGAGGAGTDGGSGGSGSDGAGGSDSGGGWG